MRWSCHQLTPKIGGATIETSRPKPCRLYGLMKRRSMPRYAMFQRLSERWRLVLKHGLALIYSHTDRRARHWLSRSRGVLALVMLSSPRTNISEPATCAIATGSTWLLSVRKHLPGCCVFKTHLVNSWCGQRGV